jgi:hypothetical protein
MIRNPDFSLCGTSGVTRFPFRNYKGISAGYWWKEEPYSDAIRRSLERDNAVFVVDVAMLFQDVLATESNGRRFVAVQSSYLYESQSRNRREASVTHNGPTILELIDETFAHQGV